MMLPKCKDNEASQKMRRVGESLEEMSRMHSLLDKNGFSTRAEGH